jgi:uncharacterized Ntn-hydrolase superfamily protein
LFPFEQYGSAESQYDWILLAYAEQVKPEGLGSNYTILISKSFGINNKQTYSRVLGSTHRVGTTRDVSRVTHEDDCLDLVSNSAGDRCSSAGNALVGITTSTESVIADLSSLRVSDIHQLSVGTRCGKAVDLIGDGLNSSLDRRCVAVASSSWVVDDFGSRAGVCVQDEVDDSAC